MCNNDNFPWYPPSIFFILCVVISNLRGFGTLKTVSTPQFSSIYKDDKENLRMKKKVGWGEGERKKWNKEGELREGKNLAVAEDDI